MKSYFLAFIAAALFAVAAVLTFINGDAFRGGIATVGGLSFLLAGIHWKRKQKR